MACNKRLLLLGICILQLIATIWRQIFDFLGFMWGPIIMNFFEIIAVIFGFFGGWQYKSSYTAVYCIWSFFWVNWNSFVFCYYLNIGVLNREKDLLSLGAGSVSWWESNGPGCKAFFLPNQTELESEPWAPPRPHLVVGCLVQYYILEAVQAALHALFALIGLIVSISLLRNSTTKHPGSPKGKKKANQAPLFPVDLIPRRVTNGPDFMSEGDSVEDMCGGQSGSRPMTPRRVKRRSDSRGELRGGPGAVGHTAGRSSGAGTLPRRHHGRSSTRSSRRHGGSSSHRQSENGRTVSGHTNLMFRHSPENSVDEERPPSARSSYSNFHGTRAHSYRHFLVSGPPAYTPQSETPI